MRVEQSMLRESLQRWVGTTVTGKVTLRRLRCGDDYSIIDTSGRAPRATSSGSASGHTMIGFFAVQL